MALGGEAEGGFGAVEPGGGVDGPGVEELEDGEEGEGGWTRVSNLGLYRCDRAD